MPLSLLNIINGGPSGSMRRSLVGRTLFMGVLLVLVLAAWTVLNLLGEQRRQQASILQVQAHIKTLLETTVSMAETEFSLRRDLLLRKHGRVLDQLRLHEGEVDYALLNELRTLLNQDEQAGHYELSYSPPGEKATLTTSPAWMLGDRKMFSSVAYGTPGRPMLGFSLGVPGGRSILAFARSRTKSGEAVQTTFESNILRRNFDLMSLSLRDAGLARKVEIFFVSGEAVFRLQDAQKAGTDVTGQVHHALARGEWRADDGSGRLLLPLAPADYGAENYSWAGPQIVVGVVPALQKRPLYMLLAGPLLVLIIMLGVLRWNYRVARREVLDPLGDAIGVLQAGEYVDQTFLNRQKREIREVMAVHNETLARSRACKKGQESVIQELEQTKIITQLFMEHSEDSMLVLDREGLVYACNEVTARWLEGSVEELMGSVVYDRWPAHIAAERKASALKAMDTGREVTLEDHRNGRYFLHRIIPVKLGEPGRYVAVFTRNITAEATASAQREDIEHVMRHNLKSPLQGALSLAEIFRDADNLTDVQRRCVDMMEEMARQTLDLVNFMLDMRRMETGEYEAERTPVDVLRVLRRCMQQQEHLVEAKELQVEVLLDGHPLGENDVLLVQGQEGLLLMLLNHLVANALEASPDGETVRLSFDSGTGRCSIFNRGAVPFEIRHRFFEKYVTFGKTGGTGLGTYSVWLICRALEYPLAPVFSSDATEVRVDFRLAD